MNTDLGYLDVLSWIGDYDQSSWFISFVDQYNGTYHTNDNGSTTRACRGYQLDVPERCDLCQDAEQRSQSFAMAGLRIVIG
jgi:hypothetical protein